jgi:hypothetical protein
LLDEGLKKYLGHTQAPLVLAGADYLLPIYRAVSGYPEVLEEGIVGNPEIRGGEALHEQAWQLVGPRFNARRSEARERFYAMESQEKSSNRLTEALLPPSMVGSRPCFTPKGLAMGS